MPSTHRPGVAAAVAVGVLAGGLSGLFGVGGGILVVPGLVMILGFAQRRAHGTSLAAIVPIALSGTVGFAIERSVDWPVAALLVAGSLLGAVIGTHALARLPVDVLRVGFALVLLMTAVRLVVDIPDASGRESLDVAAAVGLAGIGLLAGTLAGLLGVGGGVVMVPALILLFAVPDAVAKGTSLAVIIPTAIVATARNLRTGNADLRIAAVVGIAGVASAFVASQIAVDLDPTVSSVLFAALLAVTAARMLIRGRPRSQAVPPSADSTAPGSAGSEGGGVFGRRRANTKASTAPTKPTR